MSTGPPTSSSSAAPARGARTARPGRSAARRSRRPASAARPPTARRPAPRWTATRTTPRTASRSSPPRRTSSRATRTANPTPSSATCAQRHPACLGRVGRRAGRRPDDRGFDRRRLRARRVHVARVEPRRRRLTAADPRAVGPGRPPAGLRAHPEGHGPHAGFAGLTFLGSASARGAAGNGDSTEPAFARAGKAVVFTSRASNLVSGDANGTTDVFERTFTRRFSSRRGSGQQALRSARASCPRPRRGAPATAPPRIRTRATTAATWPTRRRRATCCPATATACPTSPRPTSAGAASSSSGSRSRRRRRSATTTRRTRRSAAPASSSCSTPTPRTSRRARPSATTPTAGATCSSGTGRRATLARVARGPGRPGRQGRLPGRRVGRSGDLLPGQLRRLRHAGHEHRPAPRRPAAPRASGARVRPRLRALPRREVAPRRIHGQFW